MRRWNGWGDDAVVAHVPEGLALALRAQVGEGAVPSDRTWAETLAQVPPSRAAPHPLVSTDAGERTMHARGQSFRDFAAMRGGRAGVFPDGVARPVDDDGVRALLAWAAATGTALIPWGGGTSVAGHVNPEAGERPVVTVDLSGLCRLEGLSEEDRLATFGAGTSGPLVEAALAMHGYTLGHFPQSFELSTLGGWVATRSRGQQSLGYGRIEELFAGGHLETPRGPLELPPFPSSSAGPDLREWVLGSEGRLGILTRAVVRVSPRPEREQFQALLLPDWESALACARGLAQDGPALSLLRLHTPEETEMHFSLAAPPGVKDWASRALGVLGYGEGRCLVLLGASGTKRRVREALAEAEQVCGARGSLKLPGIGEHWRKSRFKNPYLRAALWEKGWGVDTVESAVNWTKLPALRTSLEAALASALSTEGERVLLGSHVSHVYGSGANLYTTFLFRLARDVDETLARWQRLKVAASEALVREGATLSHQHGVGVDHAPYLAAEKGPVGMEALRAVVTALDPGGILNPGKLL